MKIIEPSYEILAAPTGAESILAIERAARTCYKSEDRITNGSAETLVRRLLESGHHAMIEFGGRVCVKFISNRGFTHEMVRHRLASFAQESTRYCNYSKGKFDSQVTFVNTLEELNDIQKEGMRHCWYKAEQHYLTLVADGMPAQIAREVLPIGIKAEIVVDANVREWRHIFKQRCSKKAHPRMRELMNPLLEELQKSISVIFEDL